MTVFLFILKIMMLILCSYDVFMYVCVVVKLLIGFNDNVTQKYYRNFRAKPLPRTLSINIGGVLCF